MHIREKIIILFLLLLIVAVQSCRNDELVNFVEENVVPATASGDARGMYLLCEGNMGANKCTVDYLDLSNVDGQTYFLRNIFASRNPHTVKELGDVGNDIQVYGSRLWIVVNCSNKVEVCSADSCHRIGQVNIPNCRYVVFHGRYAYVSSYVGPVQMSTNTQLGRVYKVDTLTLAKVDSVTVGYQPEEMAIVGNKLYVANSGGYRVPDYDRTVSVVDLATFHEERKIDVAPNLHRLRADKYGQLWVSSRGDYNAVPSRLYYLSKDNAGNMQVAGCVDVQVSEMCLVGDTLYYQGTQWNNITAQNTSVHGLVNVATHEQISSRLFDSPQVKAMTLPYGLIVNPVTKDFYLFDAKDYVSSGVILHFRADGTFVWKQNTGDIPSRAVFVSTSLAANGSQYEPSTTGSSPYICAVDEYMPAPGQFVNVLPKYEPGDGSAEMTAKCTQAIGGGRDGMVSLGGYGGYITFHFDHSVKNVAGEYDLYIKGNAHSGSSEPGIVMVSQDENANGLPDDDWYELSGSADMDSIGKVEYGYEITYRYSEMNDVPWTDSHGKSGVVYRNRYHDQEYFPLWLASCGELKYRGTLLPANGYLDTFWKFRTLRYGYVDNVPNTDENGNSFDIGWAVEPISRRAVHLEYIDFVRVYNATNQQCGDIGEISTEICGAKDLHVK